MPSTSATRLRRFLTLTVGLLIVKVTVEVMLGYANYFPPNFSSDFLRGRNDYFFGSYQWAFYAHIASGPPALFLGLLLLSDRFRTRHLQWHRYLGRLHTLNVLCILVPSGLWMSPYAAPGTVSAVSFTILSGLTGLFIALGWRAAVRRQFVAHRRWMHRSFVLLCSAVVLRLLGGLGTVIETQVLWFDPLISWACWVLPLTAFEALRHRSRVAIILAYRGETLPDRRSH
jgi:uncharacterized membrane protein